MSGQSRWRAEDVLAVAGPYLGLLLVVGLFILLTWRRGTLDTFLSLTNLRVVTVHAAIPATVF